MSIIMAAVGDILIDRMELLETLEGVARAPPAGGHLFCELGGGFERDRPWGGVCDYSTTG